MRELSLFTGAGGGLLGTKLLGWKACGYVEWNEYCQRVLAQRIADGYLERAPIFTDVREFVQSGAAEQYRGIADVVSAGFPCQPFSVAGKQLAADDERNMWPATLEVIRRVQPRSVLLENVPGLVSCGYLGTVLCGLAALGYVGRWGVLGASDVGAPHARQRLWVVAHLEDSGSARAGDLTGKACAYRGRRTRRHESTLRPAHWADGSDRSEPASAPPHVADPDRAQRTGMRGTFGVREEHADAGSAGGWWATDPADDPESGVGRMAPRMANGVDRLKAIGNGQCSAVVARAWGLLT